MAINSMDGGIPGDGLEKSPYRVPGEQVKDAEPEVEKEPVTSVTTRIRYLFEDLYDRVGDAGTAAWKRTSIGALEELCKIIIQGFSNGGHVWNPNPPTRVAMRRSTRRREQVGPDRFLKEIKRDCGYDE
jgi:hypothetical protein